ncbi:hypothetical protein R3P38DRAFT_3358676 [Favolaschia claudopus]|uniref:Uncharacterized protein n=1 Tax=Favolaschia claudopus TaxID=2862362 RepID=A0AAW0B2U4_9AGAR
MNRLTRNSAVDPGQRLKSGDAQFDGERGDLPSVIAEFSAVSDAVQKIREKNSVYIDRGEDDIRNRGIDLTWGARLMNSGWSQEGDERWKGVEENEAGGESRELCIEGRVYPPAGVSALFALTNDRRRLGGEGAGDRRKDAWEHQEKNIRWAFLKRRPGWSVDILNLRNVGWIKDKAIELSLAAHRVWPPTNFGVRRDIGERRVKKVIWRSSGAELKSYSLKGKLKKIVIQVDDLVEKRLSCGSEAKVEEHKKKRAVTS